MNDKTLPVIEHFQLSWNVYISLKNFQSQTISQICSFVWTRFKIWIGRCPALQFSHDIANII